MRQCVFIQPEAGALSSRKRGSRCYLRRRWLCRFSAVLCRCEW